MMLPRTAKWWSGAEGVLGMLAVPSWKKPALTWRRDEDALGWQFKGNLPLEVSDQAGACLVDACICGRSSLLHSLTLPSAPIHAMIIPIELAALTGYRARPASTLAYSEPHFSPPLDYPASKTASPLF
jgi:hypothetical protein